MENKQKLLSAVSLCRKAGKLMPLTQLELCGISYKKVGVYSVLDENLANLCSQYLADEKEENE